MRRALICNRISSRLCPLPAHTGRLNRISSPTCVRCRLTQGTSCPTGNTLCLRHGCLKDGLFSLVYIRGNLWYIFDNGNPPLSLSLFTLFGCSLLSLTLFSLSPL